MRAFLLVAVSVLSAVPAFAHHSFAAMYFEDKMQSIEGELVEVDLRNPHSYVRIKAPDEKGVLQRWTVEWGAALQLKRQGVTRETFKIGDHVIVTGNAGRKPEDHILRMRTIVRPKDGWKWRGAFE